MHDNDCVPKINLGARCTMHQVENWWPGLLTYKYISTFIIRHDNKLTIIQLFQCLCLDFCSSLCIIVCLPFCILFCHQKVEKINYILCNCKSKIKRTETAFEQRTTHWKKISIINEYITQIIKIMVTIYNQ